jgi:DNA-directed RNA polymerase III subunit RPC4
VISLDGFDDPNDDTISHDAGSSDSDRAGKRRINVDDIQGTYNTEKDELLRLFAPVRVQRVEHLDRAPQISSSLGKDLKPMQELEGNIKDSGAQDVEIVRTARKYRGVYQDDEDDQGQPSASASSKTTSQATQKVLQPPQPKRKRKSEVEPPVLWTDDDKSEWARRKADNAALVDELSQVHLDKANEQEKDADEHVDRRRDRVYIYTFPPLLPPLLDATKEVKPEPGSPLFVRSQEAAAADGTEDEPVVIKDDPAEAATVEPADKKGAFPARPKHLPALEPGRVGKLVVRRSGRATLDWGGTSLRVGLGLTPDVLQDVVGVSGLGSDGGGGSAAVDEEGFAGQACSFGQVMGKFVVTPDWDELLGTCTG